MPFSKHFQIANRWIGEGEPCFVVAEIGLNHNGDVELAKLLVAKAKEAGADAVKFQKRNIEKILTKEGLKQKYYRYHAYAETYGEHRRNLELSHDDYRELKRHADNLGIIMFASAWDTKSVDFLETLDVPAYKIGSPDVTNLPLIEHVSKKKKPIIMSTGMSTLEEVEDAVIFIAEHERRLVLLQCVSTYPSSLEELRSHFKEINLRVMDTLRKKLSCLVGYSGHELAICVTEVAVALGASVVERHFTLNRAFKGPDHANSLEPPGLQKLVRNIRDIEESMGDGVKKLLDDEIKVRKKLAKSIVASCPIKKGEQISWDMLTMKSPALGLKAKFISQLLGRITVRNIAEDDYVKLEDVK